MTGGSIGYSNRSGLSYTNSLRDGPLFYWGGGGYHSWDLQTIFSKEYGISNNFFITFCNENNFFTTILKNITGFLIDLT